MIKKGDSFKVKASYIAERLSHYNTKPNLGEHLNYHGFDVIVTEDIIAKFKADKEYEEGYWLPLKGVTLKCIGTRTGRGNRFIRFQTGGDGLYYEIWESSCERVK